MKYEWKIRELAQVWSSIFQLLNFVHHVELIKFSSISGVEKGPGVSWECKMSFCSMMSRVIVFWGEKSSMIWAASKDKFTTQFSKLRKANRSNQFSKSAVVWSLICKTALPERSQQHIFLVWNSRNYRSQIEMRVFLQIKWLLSSCIGVWNWSWKLGAEGMLEQRPDVHNSSCVWKVAETTCWATEWFSG